MISFAPRATRVALVVSAATCLTSAASAQMSKSAEQSGKPAAPVAAVLVDRATSQAFEQGLVLALPPAGASRMPLQWVTASWHAYPNAHYRVQRSGQVTGPWVTIHDVAAHGDSLGGLPPSVRFYVRVLALRDGGKRGWVVADSSLPAVVQTPSPVMTHAFGITMRPCTAGPGDQVTIGWRSLPGFTKYVVTPFMAPPTQVGQVNSIATNPQPALVVSDTMLTYTIPVAGRMVLRVQGRADISDWPQAGQTLTYLTPMPTLPTSTGWVPVHLDSAGAHCGD